MNQPPPSRPVLQQAFCPRCHGGNSPESTTCQWCGHLLDQPDHGSSGVWRLAAGAVVGILVIAVLAVALNELGRAIPASAFATPSPAPDPASFGQRYDLAAKPSYDDLARHPESYTSTTVAFTGQVVQVLDYGSYVDMRVNMTKDPTIDFWTDDVYVSGYVGERLLENDIIEVIAQGNGLDTYQTTLGAQRTIPKLVVIEIVRVGG